MKEMVDFTDKVHESSIFMLGRQWRVPNPPFDGIPISCIILNYIGIGIGIVYSPPIEES